MFQRLDIQNGLFAEGVYVLHAFEKRTRKTPQRDLNLAGDRYRSLIAKRRADAAAKG